MKQPHRAEMEMLAGIEPAAMLVRVETWAGINTGTRNLEGLRRQARVLADAFASLPGEVTLVDPAPVTAMDASGAEVELLHGKHLVLSVRPEAARRFLLTGHMDTVFPADHDFRHTRWIDHETVNGPGTADMKGGIAVILAALTAFETSEIAKTVGYDVIINSDEETGSLSSAALIERLARGKEVALTYEPSALPDGTLAHARGGSGNYSVAVTGRSAHAGRNPVDGRNAIVAAAAIALGLKEIEDTEIPVNPARIDGGSANNVVPDHAVLRFNIRPRTQEAADIFPHRLKRLLDRIAAEHEVTMRLHGGITRPPKPVDAKAQKLFDLVKTCGEELGQTIQWQASGGVCDGNNIAACGIPVVDTMGVRGGAIHSPDEFMIVPSLKERAELSALVLNRLAKGENM